MLPSLIYYFGEINSGIHMYQFTFEPLHLCFRMWLWFQICTTILADGQIWQKQGTDRRICIPLFTPPPPPLTDKYQLVIFLNSPDITCHSGS